MKSYVAVASRQATQPVTGQEGIKGEKNGFTGTGEGVGWGARPSMPVLRHLPPNNLPTAVVLCCALPGVVAGGGAG